MLQSLSYQINDIVKFIKSEKRTPEETKKCVENSAAYIAYKYCKDRQFIENAITRRLTAIENRI